jgi:hypothetical protein
MVYHPFHLGVLDDDLITSQVLVHRRTHIKDLTSVVIRYDPETNFTTGYILTNLHEDRNLDYLRQIPNQFLGCCHPFVLPIIFIEADFENGMVLIKEFFDDLKDIEQQTEFTNYIGSEWTVGSRGRSTKNYQILIRYVVWKRISLCFSIRIFAS